MADEEQQTADAGGGADASVQEELQRVADAAGNVVEATAGSTPRAKNPNTMDVIMDVMLQVTVEVGRARMTIQDLLQLGQGSVVELEKLAGEALDVYINGKLVATGEAVIVNEKFGVRLTQIISREDRLSGLGM